MEEMASKDWATYVGPFLDGYEQGLSLAIWIDAYGNNDYLGCKQFLCGEVNQFLGCVWR